MVEATPRTPQVERKKEISKREGKERKEGKEERKKFVRKYGCKGARRS